MAWGLILRIAGPILLAIGLWTWGYSAGSAAKQRAWDLATAVQVKAQLAATEAARATEAALQQKVNDANDALAKEKAAHARIAAGLRADADRLRGDIAAYARGSADDTASACRDRSEAIGALLAEALRVGAESAADGEQCESSVRALLTAWPR